ncbi:BapA prefix-like domain-containing protein [Acinetobacter soli]|nr:BapA prefix-like domain-containing protein [Acinetobacter soli]WEI13416.1 BapA prefix-like domain-containing protein [Acinetobacter soli]
MPLIRVIGKENHKVLQELSDNSLKLDQASVVVANLPSDQIDEIVKDGTSMIIKLKDGEIIIIDQFFNEHSTNQNSLVLQDESQKLTWVQFIEAQGNSQPQLIFERVESTDALMYHGGGMAMEPVWSWAVVPLTAGVLRFGRMIIKIKIMKKIIMRLHQTQLIAVKIRSLSYLNLHRLNQMMKQQLTIQHKIRASHQLQIQIQAVMTSLH